MKFKVENLYLELFKNIKEEIKNLLTFKDVTGKIALMFFKYFNKDILELPQFVDGEKILQYIENKNNNKLVNFEKINVLIDLIKLGKYFDEYKVQNEQIEKMNNENNKKFTFEDFECFKNKFDINSILKIKNMPSFQYFLLNNYNNIEKLLKIVTNEKINNIFQPSPYIYMPFWVFIIRIMSSTNCLIFDNNENPYQKKLTQTIRRKILLSMQNNQNINLSWINIITDNIKNDIIFDKKIQMFYNFFNKFCSTKFYSKSEITEYIENILIEFYESLFEIIITNKFNELLDTEINSNKFDALDFIKDPKEYIKKFINRNILEQILQRPNCLNYSNSLNDFINVIRNAQTSLKDKVEKLEKKLKKDYEYDLILI